jgi:Tol biopolymer transport system component
VGDIYSVGADGRNLKRLTNDDAGAHPVCSPDGKWVVYDSMSNAGWTLWRVPVEGGAAQQLTDYYSTLPAISPDGRWIACFYYPEPNQRRIGIIPFAGGRPVTTLDLQRVMAPSLGSAIGVQWTPGGRALAYVDVRKGVSNIWTQPVEGGPARQLTDFRSGQVFSFAWSRDGKQLALARGTVTSDVVLIGNFR